MIIIDLHYFFINEFIGFNLSDLSPVKNIHGQFMEEVI